MSSQVEISLTALEISLVGHDPENPHRKNNRIKLHLPQTDMATHCEIIHSLAFPWLTRFSCLVAESF